MVVSTVNTKDYLKNQKEMFLELVRSTEELEGHLNEFLGSFGDADQMTLSRKQLEDFQHNFHDIAQTARVITHTPNTSMQS